MKEKVRVGTLVGDENFVGILICLIFFNFVNKNLIDD